MENIVAYVYLATLCGYSSEDCVFEDRALFANAKAAEAWLRSVCAEVEPDESKWESLPNGDSECWIDDMCHSAYIRKEAVYG